MPINHADVLWNWRKARFVLQQTPSLTCLKKSQPLTVTSDYHDVFIHASTLPSDIVEIRDWIDDLDGDAQYDLFGRFSWIERDYRVDRQFEGYVFRFKCELMAVHFRLCWQAPVPCAA